MFTESLQLLLTKPLVSELPMLMLWLHRLAIYDADLSRAYTPRTAIDLTNKCLKARPKRQKLRHPTEPHSTTTSPSQDNEVEDQVKPPGERDVETTHASQVILATQQNTLSLNVNLIMKMLEQLLIQEGGEEGSCVCGEEMREEDEL